MEVLKLLRNRIGLKLSKKLKILPNPFISRFYKRWLNT